MRRVTFMIGAAILAAISMPRSRWSPKRVTRRAQDDDFAKLVKEWTTQPYFISPLVDHLPKVTSTVPEGCPRVSHRGAGQVDLLRRRAESTTARSPQRRRGSRSKPSARPTKTASWSSSGCRPTRTSITFSRIATTWPDRRSAWPVRRADHPARGDDATALSLDGRIA